MRTHWLLPIDPAAHAEHQPTDWRTRPDATEVWAAIGRSQAIGRWCLRSGYRTMQAGDVIWAYLSKRQEVCARGEVAAVAHEVSGDGGGQWFVEVDWDAKATPLLTRNPLSRSAFGQVPMSTCRARPEAVEALERHLRGLVRGDLT